MKKNALLIVFGYEKEKILPSAKQELILAEQFCKQAQYDTVEIITDLYEKNITNEVFAVSLLKVCSKAKELFIYYSGHCKNNQWIFPNKKKYNVRTILYTLDQQLLPNYKLFILMDCCYAPFIPLMYIYQKTIKTHENELVLNGYCSILCSTEPHHVSKTTIEGSAFSKYFFTCNNSITWLVLLEQLQQQINLQNLGYLQKPILYTNIYTDKVWSWIYSNNNKIYVPCLTGGEFILT